MRLAGSLSSMTLILCLAGCGGPSYGSVSGEITVNGVPLTQGLVTFSVENGVPDVVSAGVVEGKYSIEKVPVGKAKIALQSLQPSGSTLLPNGTMSIPIKGDYVSLDDRFKDANKSNLSYEVKSGEQKHSFDVKSD